METDQPYTLTGSKSCHFSKIYGYFAKEKARQDLKNETVKKIHSDWLKKRFPQNFIIRNPLAGSLIIAAFCFGFLILYRPLNSHEGYNLTYTQPMALYSFLAGAFL